MILPYRLSYRCLEMIRRVIKRMSIWQKVQHYGILFLDYFPLHFCLLLLHPFFTVSTIFAKSSCFNVRFSPDNIDLRSSTSLGNISTILFICLSFSLDIPISTNFPLRFLESFFINLL